MARIEIIQQYSPTSPASTESLEVLAWGPGGLPSQMFCISSGFNCDATGTIWIEVRYSVQDIPIFYTRNMLQLSGHTDAPKLEASLHKFENGEWDSYSFGDILPQTHLSIKRDRRTYTDHNNETQTHDSYSLNLDLDIGAVFGGECPGERMFAINLDELDPAACIRFMRQFNDEVAAAGQGKHPNPGSLPAGFSDFPFALTLNRRAYDLASADYQEQYFYNQNVAAAFDTWLAGLPAGGQVLDAGCGHGDPVISRLLERGFQVTGCDLSPAMLGLARQKFPGVSFLECPITSLETRDAFDGACSFSSMLYLDPIDFLHATHRLHRALRPGGLLFLFGCDPSPDTRGDPYGVDLKNWMWGGRRGIQETVQALEEHGYFQVLQAQETTIPEEREQVLERWRANVIMRHEELLKEYTPEANIPEPNLDNPPQLPFGYVITARRLER